MRFSVMHSAGCAVAPEIIRSAQARGPSLAIAKIADDTTVGRIFGTRLRIDVTIAVPSNFTMIEERKFA